jgi:hypothetical protein
MALAAQVENVLGSCSSPTVRTTNADDRRWPELMSLSGMVEIPRLQAK